MRIAITGATGMLGQALTARLRADGHHVAPVSRDPQIASRGGIHWDPLRGVIDAGGFASYDAVINLAGARIAPTLWTAHRKWLIRASRVKSTEALAQALSRLDPPPRVLLSASAVGYYGNRDPGDILDESQPPGGGFLSGVCVEWEAATAPAAGAGIRVVRMRQGVVLSGRGGFLGPLLPFFRLGLGGRLGSGRQDLSWIAIRDYLAAVDHLLHREDLRGPVNLTSPHPVTNDEFTRALARAVRRPALVPVPAVALRLVFGREMTAEVLLTSQRAVPRVLLESGFVFSYPSIDPALAAVLSRP